MLALRDVPNRKSIDKVGGDHATLLSRQSSEGRPEFLLVFPFLQVIHDSVGPGRIWAALTIEGIVGPGALPIELPRFIAGDRFSSADILLSTCLSWAIDYGVPVSRAAVDYNARLKARPAYERAIEQNRAPADHLS